MFDDIQHFLYSLPRRRHVSFYDQVQTVINGQEDMILIKAVTSELACSSFTALNQRTHFYAVEKKTTKDAFHSFPVCLR